MHRHRWHPQQARHLVLVLVLGLVLVLVLAPLQGEVRHASCCLYVNRPRCGCSMRRYPPLCAGEGNEEGEEEEIDWGITMEASGEEGSSAAAPQTTSPGASVEDRSPPRSGGSFFIMLRAVLWPAGRLSCLQDSCGRWRAWCVVRIPHLPLTDAAAGPSPSAASPQAGVGGGSMQSPNAGTPASAPVASPAAAANSSPAVGKPPAAPAPDSVAAPASGSGPFGMVPLVLAAMGALVLGAIAWVVLSPQSRTGEEL